MKSINHRLLVFLGCILVALHGCTVNNAPPENSCILNEIQFAEDSRLIFTTISGGQIYQLRQEFLREDADPLVVASFQFQYFVDSLVVKNQLETELRFPYMTVSFEDERPKRVEKYFGGSGVRLIHEIDYSNNDRILIDLYREASDGQILYAGYSNYFTDQNGNITRNERFFADREDPSIFNKFEDITFEYDAAVSPQQNLFLPFFTDTNFPDARFFSPNNVLLARNESGVFNYQYSYDDFGNMTSMIQPDGTPVYFRYIGCSQ